LSLSRRATGSELAIAKLGWIPNEPARQLRAGCSRSIGMIVMDIANPFYTDLVIGAENWYMSAATQYKLE
jgi:LacI family transcriptional regulator